MRLKKYPWGEFVELSNSSSISDVEPMYKDGTYAISLEGEYSEAFFDLFVENFSQIKVLHHTNENDGELSYLYKLTKLEEIIFHFYSKMNVLVDFAKVSPLRKLGMNWYIKYIKNLDAQKELKHLSISDFTEKDFKRIPVFDKLKSFRSIGGKLKTLENIEAIKNIVALEISAHRGLSDITAITALKNLKFVEFNSCWKLADFSPLAELKELEVVKIIDCKNLASIKFVGHLPKLRQLYTLGTTIINDFDTTPAKNVPVFFGSLYDKYNVQYPEKEIMEGQKTWSSYVKN